MNLYRAIYATRSDTSRHMTFCAPDYSAAQVIAADWQLSDDRLWAVITIRQLERPVFNLTSEVTA